MKKVLLTGSTGFIGRNCLSYLRRKQYEIHAVSRQPERNSTESVTWHRVNLLDPKETGQLLRKLAPTHLLHFAWYVEHGKYWSALENFDWTAASIHLLREFHRNGGQRVVMAGTCAEYDWSLSKHSETSLLGPATVYGACKTALQSLLASFSRETGLSSAWGRIFFVYGPHEPPERLVSSVIRSLLHGREAKCGSGEEIHDFSYVEDVADAFVQLLDSTVTGPVDIASGNSRKIREIVFQIADALGRRDLVRLNALPSSPNSPCSLKADTAKVLHEVKWEPRFSLESGIEKTIQWWKNHENHN